MSSERTRAKLAQLASELQAGSWVVECGTYMGANIQLISDALPDIPLVFHAFDYFLPNAQEVKRAAEQGLKLEAHKDCRSVVRQLLALPPQHEVYLHQGPLLHASWDGTPIDLFLLDAAKLNPSFQHVIDTFQPAWKAGARVCLLDAYYREDDSKRDCQRKWLREHYPDHERLESGAFFTA